MAAQRTSSVLCIIFFYIVIIHNTTPLFAQSDNEAALTKKRMPNFENGKKIYRTNCAYCHSIKGDGKNWIGSFILPHPRNFTDKKVMKDITRNRMFTSILNGRPGTSMPTWRGLISEDDINDVIYYIEKKFIKR